MNLNDHYTALRGDVSKGKSPQARLASFTAGMSGLIEQHADSPDDIKSIGAELRNNGQKWTDLVFETRV